MATNFPATLDDVTTLGGVFVNAAPVVDPATNIDADFRNNLNDAILAIEARVGLTNSTVPASLSWATLSAGGVDNLGLRFAQTEVEWPGLIAESGVFYKSITLEPMFHRAGEPKATFYSMLNSGAFSWGSLYASDKLLDINGAVLEFTQSTVTGTGFKVDRDQAVSDAATMIVQNVNVADAQAALSVIAAASNLALSVIGAITQTVAVGPVVPFETYTSTVTSGGIDGTGLVGLVNFQSNITGSAGDTNTAVMCGFKSSYTDGVGSSASIGFWADATHFYGVYSQSDVAIDVTTTGRALEITQNGAGDLLRLSNSSETLQIGQALGVVHELTPPVASFNAYQMDLTSGGLPLGTETVFGLRLNLTGNAADIAGSSIVGISLSNFNISGSAASTTGIFIGSDYDTGLYSESLFNITTDLAVGGNPVFGVLNNNIAGPELAWFKDGGANAVRWKLEHNGHIEHIADAAIGMEALKITQNDTDEPFIRYEGTSIGDASANISTRNGNGAVEGPKAFGGNPGWQFEGMTRQSVNGVDFWVPYYSVDLS